MEVSLKQADLKVKALASNYNYLVSLIIFYPWQLVSELRAKIGSSALCTELPQAGLHPSNWAVVSCTFAQKVPRAAQPQSRGSQKP